MLLDLAWSVLRSEVIAFISLVAAVAHVAGLTIAVNDDLASVELHAERPGGRSDSQVLYRHHPDQLCTRGLGGDGVGTALALLRSVWLRLHVLIDRRGLFRLLEWCRDVNGSLTLLAVMPIDVWSVTDRIGGLVDDPRG